MKHNRRIYRAVARSAERLRRFIRKASVVNVTVYWFALRGLSWIFAGRIKIWKGWKYDKSNEESNKENREEIYPDW